MNWIYIANRVLLVLALLGGMTFVAVYQITSAWWKSDVGRNMMAFVFSEVIILGLSVQVWLFGDFPGRQIFGIVAFALFTVASWWRAAVLIRTIFKRRKADRDRMSSDVR